MFPSESNHSSCCILDTLEWRKIRYREAGEERVTIVQMGGDEGVNKFLFTSFSEYAYILGCMTPRDLIVVAKPMFAGSWNTMML